MRCTQPAGEQTLQPPACRQYQGEQHAPYELGALLLQLSPIDREQTSNMPAHRDVQAAKTLQRLSQPP